MGIVRVKFEVVRYLAAKARYENDECCKKIMQLVTYKRRSTGFSNLLEYPYYKDGNSPRALNIISDTLADRLGGDWYKLVLVDGGIEHIAGVLQNITTNTIVNDANVTDADVLNFCKQYEVVVVHKRV